MDSASTSASAVTAPAPLDDIDRRIVDALQRQGRMTFDELAGQVQLSASAVLRRGELTAVYVVRGGRFMLQAVRTSTPATSSGPITLLSGVRPGDIIAADALKAGLANATPAKP